MSKKELKSQLIKERADRFLEFVTEKGWNKAEIARKFDILPQHVNKYLDGTYDPMGLADKLVEYGCDITWFLSGRKVESATPYQNIKSENSILGNNSSGKDLNISLGKGSQENTASNALFATLNDMIQMLKSDKAKLELRNIELEKKVVSQGEKIEELEKKLTNNI